MIHSRVSWMCLPADRPHQLLDFLGDARRHRGVADVGVDLGQEVAADDHRLAFRVVDVARDDRAAAGDLVADEFGGDDLLDVGAEALARVLLEQVRLVDRSEPLILADRDELHLRGDEAATRVVHLGDVGTRERTARRRAVAEAHRVEPRVVLALAAELG